MDYIKKKLKAMDLETSMFLYQGFYQRYALPVWGEGSSGLGWGTRLRALLTLDVQ